MSDHGMVMVTVASSVPSKRVWHTLSAEQPFEDRAPDQRAGRH